MGAYYHYVNFTKEEQFSIGSLGGSIKFGDIGNTLSARAFELMLLRPLPNTLSEEYRICGRWHGDNVSIEADDVNPLWDQFSNFTNIGADTIVMLYEVDGFEPLAKSAEMDEFFFVQLCYLVVTNQVPEFESELEKAFGKDFRKKYEELSEETWAQPLNIVLRDDV